MKSRSLRTLSFHLLCLGACWMTPPGRASAAESESSGGPYCGIYSLVAALSAEGVPVELSQLLSPKYVGSENGSSLAELERAARDCGAYAHPMKNLGAAFLQSCSHPVILHVRRPGKGMPYSHWVVFLGTEDGRARVVDPPLPVESMTFAQLLAISDGVGLVVSREPISTPPASVPVWLNQIAILVLTGLSLWTARSLFLNPASSGFGAGCRFAALVLVVSLASASVWHAAQPEGFLFNRSSIGAVAANHFDPPIEELSLEEVKRLVNRGEVRVIDARLARDYAGGHIPEAVNLPVVSGRSERERILASLDSAETVVVYCQSDGCTWAKSIASDLYFRGHQRIMVYRGGWAEWSASQ